MEVKRSVGMLLADLSEKVELAVLALEEGDEKGFGERWRVVRNRVYAAQNVLDQEYVGTTARTRSSQRRRGPQIAPSEIL